MNKEEIKEIKEQMYYLDSELYSYQDIDNLKEYAKNLEKENQQLKKQKDDVVIKYIKNLIKRLDEFDILERKETGAFWYQVMGELKELLRMLGETDVED